MPVPSLLGLVELAWLVAVVAAPPLPEGIMMPVVPVPVVPVPVVAVPVAAAAVMPVPVMPVPVAAAAVMPMLPCPVLVVVPTLVPPLALALIDSGAGLDGAESPELQPSSWFDKSRMQTWTDFMGAPFGWYHVPRLTLAPHAERAQTQAASVVACAFASNTRNPWTT